MPKNTKITNSEGIPNRLHCINETGYNKLDYHDFKHKPEKESTQGQKSILVVKNNSSDFGGKGGIPNHSSYAHGHIF